MMRSLAGGVYGVLLWVVALWLAWLALAALDFLYPLAYGWLDIGATLQTYVPQNRFGRQDYPVADVGQQMQHFAAISHAIHLQGAGLAQLSYHDAQGKVLGLLLTRDEVLHLQDVARLVTGGMAVGAVGTLLWLAWLAILPRLMPGQGWRLPSLSVLLLGSAAVLVVVGAVLAAFGFESVFYALHRLIFPADHAWFFYYQDSLMSSLMQAPHLFAVIGVAWLVLSLALLLLLDTSVRFAIRRIQSKFSNQFFKGETA
ncbi:MAG: hypothetical protein B7Y40_03985 [Gammaproteobacteria bacterium 28-57-27]|nr:MAG: hypothetical protein B7Y40_03985 [Gammaproteobacteria bacterium 28-57-27]